MKLAVSVQSREVAILESVGDFKSVLTYHADCPPELLVSLTMPVRTQSWDWDDQLPPVFQMNLPEGYLLQVLQESFGPHISASPLALLSVIGRNMVGRLQVTPVGAHPSEPPQPVDVADLLKGDNSEEAFSQLVRRYAASGVSGVVPKFLAPGSPEPKATLLTAKHIIKGSSHALPHIALNEHFCMEVARRVTSAARTRVSEDGNALVVDRFDLAANGQPQYGMEDFCALLGMRPANKYETTWERIAKAVRTFMPAHQRHKTWARLTQVVLLTYALRNADCHAKNLALLYTGRQDAALAPCYDMLTTAVYAGYQHNPPAIAFMGKKTWKPGKALRTFLTNTFDAPPLDQQACVEQIGDAMADVAPQLREAMGRLPTFENIGARILHTWQEGLSSLRNKQHYALPIWQPPEAFRALPSTPKLQTERETTGQSELLGKRR